MPIKGFFATITLGLLSATAIAVLAAPQSTPPAPLGRPATSQQAQSAQSGYVLKVTTRLVTIDLIATDSHGKTVRDLKPEDLQIFEEHNAQQKIEHFEFVDKGASTEPAKDSASVIRRPANFYSNQVPVEGLKVPPTVLLIDGLNTRTENQMQGRLHLLKLLKTLPAETPVAVFLLGNSLKVLQGFTDSRALLQAALDHALTGNPVEQDPADDLNDVSNSMINLVGSDEPDIVQNIQDFEKEQYAGTIDLRARQTLDSLTLIAQYLSGIPGRKNLIWASESFPFWIMPSSDTGNNVFAGTRIYADQITAAANALTDAQVAVYPMDVQGLQTQQFFTASQPTMRNRTSGPQVSSQLDREQNARFQTQSTMDELAQDTGGKTCKNTNDLSGCVVTALNDSSAYYELAFYPQNVNWDGQFRRIVVKTSRPHVKLTYRRGYFAFDAASLAKKQQPEDHMRQGCSDLLPSTAVHLSAQEVASNPSSGSLAGLHYLLSISADGLGVSQEGESRNLALQLGICEFEGKNESFRFYTQDLTKTVSDEVFRSWQAGGIPGYVSFAPPSNTRRLRFVVLDVSTGLTGAVDVPVLPSDIARANAAVPPPAQPATLSFLEIPDKEQTPSSPTAMGSVTFRLKSGQSGSLDWNGDVLLYRGDISVDQSASAFFGYAYGNKFHCESGRLVPTDPADGEPVLRFTFHNHDGMVVTVDLKGEHPEYLGDLPVDPTAKTMFEQVWKTSHCQAP